MGSENTQLLDRVRCSILVAVTSAGEADGAELSTAAAAERVRIGSESAHCGVGLHVVCRVSQRPAS